MFSKGDTAIDTSTMYKNVEEFVVPHPLQHLELSEIFILIILMIKWEFNSHLQ